MPEFSQGASPILLLEYWKPVVGYEGLYEISNTGRVYSYYSKRELAPVPHTRSKYLYVKLTDAVGRRGKRLNCLVADAFLGPRPAGMEVGHKNHSRHFNNVSNLYFVSHRQNLLDSALAGRLASRLTLDQIQSVRLMKGKVPCKQVASEFKVTIHVVYDIWSGRTWSYLS